MLDDGKDVDMAEDASFFLQHALAAENHCQMSYMSTKDDVWIEIADMIRGDRSKLMYKLIKESKAQTYCISKHLLAMSQAMKELANRYTELKDTQSVKECLEASKNYEALFRLILADMKGGKK